MVEGHSRFALPFADLHRPFLAYFYYPHHSGFQIGHNRSRRHAQGCDVLRLQEIRTRRLLLRSLFAIVCPSIHFDGEQATQRSEEHTSELQSLMRISYAVFCLKKTKT